MKYVNLFTVFGVEGIAQYAVLLATIRINIILTVLATVVDISLEFYWGDVNLTYCLPYTDPPLHLFNSVERIKTKKLQWIQRLYLILVLIIYWRLLLNNQIKGSGSDWGSNTHARVADWQLCWKFIRNSFYADYVPFLSLLKQHIALWNKYCMCKHNLLCVKLF